MKKLSKFAAISAASLLLPQSAMAFAYDAQITGHVTYIEPTYVPDLLIFQMDVGAGPCPAQSSLSWNIRGTTDAQKVANVQAVLAVLMTAKASRQTVDAFINYSDCSVSFLHWG